jgi:hypothetical protein
MDYRTEPNMKTWTIKTIRDGEAVRVDQGVAHMDAVSAVYRAMRGEDPIGSGLERERVNGEHSPLAEKALAA